MVAKNDSPAEEIMGLIDANTPLGRKFEVDNKKLEFCGIDAMGNVAYRNGKGAIESMSLDSWNADIAPKVDGFTDPQGTPKADAVTEAVTVEPVAENIHEDESVAVEDKHKMTSQQEEALFAMQSRIRRAKSDEVDANDTYKGLKKRREALEDERDKFLAEIEEGVIAPPMFISQEPKTESSATRADAIGTDDDSSWRAVPLASLIDPEIKPGVLKALMENDPSITTMGELVDWQAAKGDFWAKDINGVGTAAQDSIADATFAFWTRWNAEKTKDAEILAKAQS